MRIAIIGFLHESNTFVHTKTTRDNFAACNLHIGKEVLDHWQGAHHEVGGFLEGALQYEFDPVPILVAVAMPAGPLTADTFESLWHDISAGLQHAGNLDGILLALHGATVADNAHDADGEMVARIRHLVGNQLPIVMTLDLHANVSKRMIEGVTATVLYRTTPHVDQRERGLEAAKLMARTVRGEIQPVQAIEFPPMLSRVIKQDSSEEPAATALCRLEEACQQPSILSASIGYGFAYADVPEMGTSIIVVADGDHSAASKTAKWLGRQVWDRRHDFVGDLPTPQQAIQQAAAWEEQPVVVSDIGDNIAAGAPGDSTVLLAEVIRQNVTNALIVLWDPQAVAECAAAGVQNQVSLDVGGKSRDQPGQPVHISGSVRTLSDGLFFEPHPRHGGRSENDQGLTAVVETDQGHTIALTSHRMAPLSLRQILSLGIDPLAKKIIVVKAVIAPRAAYAPVTAHHILSDTPGTTASNFLSLNHQHRRRPLFPWEATATY